MEKLLILRLGSMGDILHALPGAAALRRAFPSATIGWAVEQRWSGLLCARGAENAAAGAPDKPLVDRLHFINTVAWRKAPFSNQMWKEAWSAMSALRAARYELAVDFQGAWKSAGLALWSAAPERIGLDRPRERPAAMFYTRRVLTTSRHVVDQGLELAAAASETRAGATVLSFAVQRNQRELVRRRATPAWAAGFRAAQSGRRLGREALAAGKLWPGRRRPGAPGTAVTHQLRSQ